MNTPRTIKALAAFALGLGASIALAGEPAATVAPTASHAAARLAPAEKIPSIVITAKRLTAEQKASMDQAEGKQGMKKLAAKKRQPKGVTSAGSDS